MKTERALSIRDRTLSSLRDCFSSAEHFGTASAILNDRKLAIMERCKAAPHWVRSYLDGYWACLIDGAYRRALVFGGKIDGVFYSTHSDRADYYERHGIEPREFADDGRVKERGHYWHGDGSKPFFTS